MLAPREPLAGVIFGLVLAENVANLPFRDSISSNWIGIEGASSSTRQVRAAAIARSMGLSETTVRRKLNELVDARLVTRGEKGFGISHDFTGDPLLAVVCAKNARCIADALSRLAYTGMVAAPDGLRAIDALPPNVVERLLLTFEVRALEGITNVYGDVTAGIIVSAVVAANVRHITENPALSLQFAGDDSVPPDALRRPVPLRAIAKAVALPFETVRRRAVGLISKGVMVPSDTGVYVPARVFGEPTHIEENRRLVLHFQQLTVALAALLAKAERRPC
jgi:DNA-binding Lrp family transcriptional regulator